MATGKNTQHDFFTFGALLSIVAIWWGIEIVDHILFSGGLDRYGIYPRELSGLLGVLFAPFLHGDYSHVLSNTVPFLLLGYIVLKAERLHFYLTSLAIIVVGGLGTWLIGRESVHVGASGLIYGYFGYVILRGIGEKKIKWILLAIVVGVVFGGMIWGVFPSVGKQGISWEGHLCGMIAGGVIGYKRAKRPTRAVQTR